MLHPRPRLRPNFIEKCVITPETQTDTNRATSDDVLIIRCSHTEHLQWSHHNQNCV